MKDLNLIELTDLEKRYGKKEALTGINLTIGRGKIIGLLGPNGSGKTTLIKLLNGLLQPTSGEIKVFVHIYLEFYKPVRLNPFLTRIIPFFQTSIF